MITVSLTNLGFTETLQEIKWHFIVFYCIAAKQFEIGPLTRTDISQEMLKSEMSGVTSEQITN